MFLIFNNTVEVDGHLRCTYFTLVVRGRSSVPPWELLGSEPLRKRSLVWDHLIPAENLQLLLFLPLFLPHPARLVDLRTRWLMPERSLQTLDTHSAHWGRSCWRRLVRRKEEKKKKVSFYFESKRHDNGAGISMTIINWSYCYAVESFDFSYMVRLLVCGAPVEEVWLVWQDGSCWSLQEIGKERPIRSRCHRWVQWPTPLSHWRGMCLCLTWRSDSASDQTLDFHKWPKQTCTSLQCKLIKYLRRSTKIYQNQKSL